MCITAVEHDLVLARLRRRHASGSGRHYPICGRRVRLTCANIGLAAASDHPASKAGAMKIWRENRRELPPAAEGRADRINPSAARVAAAALLRPDERLGLAYSGCERPMLADQGLA